MTNLGAKLTYGQREFTIKGEDAFATLSADLNQVLLGTTGHEPVLTVKHTGGTTTIAISAGIPITVDLIEGM